MEEKNIKAVIYARYSSDNQREESIEGQLRECTAFTEKNDITVLRHYIDRAYSAKTNNRPEFQHMIKDSSKHLFDMVIVWKLMRLPIVSWNPGRVLKSLCTAALSRFTAQVGFQKVWSRSNSFMKSESPFAGIP